MTNEELLQLQVGDLIELQPRYNMNAAILSNPGLTLQDYKHKCGRGSWNHREFVIAPFASSRVVLIEKEIDKLGAVTHTPWWLVKAVCPDRGVVIFGIPAQCVKKVAVHSDA